MTQTAMFVCIFLSAIAIVHFYWAGGGSAGKSGAIPSTDGRAIFSPRPVLTALIGCALIAMAVVVGSTAGLIPRFLPLNILRLASAVLAFIFAARAVGEFRYVGFFKKVRGSVFALRDTYIYSPLCLLFACAIAFIAFDS